MSDEFITPDNLSTELLKEICESAYLDFTVDEDGDLKVKDSCSVFVRPDLERKNRIRLLAAFRFTDGSSELARLECVNRINDEYIMICASTTANGVLLFRYDIMIEAGMPKKGLVLAIKRFASIPHGAVQDHGGDIVQ